MIEERKSASKLLLAEELLKLIPDERLPELQTLQTHFTGQCAALLRVKVRETIQRPLDRVIDRYQAETIETAREVTGKGA